MSTLEVEKRGKADTLQKIRKNGLIPAVYYGPKEPSTSISMKEADFLKIWKEAGESSIVKLKTSQGLHDALIHEVSMDPVSGKVIHADFYIVEKGKKIKVRVPIEFEGNAPAVKELGGTLVKVLHDVEIEAEAANLPHNLVVDISSLASFDSQITAKDIKLPGGVALAENPDEVVVLVTETKEEVEEVAPVDLESIEISDQKGKKEETEEGTMPEENPPKQ